MMRAPGPRMPGGMRGLLFLCVAVLVNIACTTAARVPSGVVAHRGASADWPENTLPALDAAVRAKAAWVEFDTFEARDGVAFLMHDRTLDRTTDAATLYGPECLSSSLDWSQVQRLDAGAWKGAAHRGTPVPSLEQALQLLGGTPAMIERKHGSPESVLEPVRRLQRVQKDVVQSFDWEWLQAVHALEPTLVLGALGSGVLDEAALDAIARTGARFVHWKHTDLRPEDVTRVHARGWAVGAYTVDDPVRTAELRAMGVDFVTTNRP